MARKPINAGLISADELEWRRRKAHQPRQRSRDERILMSQRGAFGSSTPYGGMPAAPSTPMGGGTPYGAMTSLAIAQSAQATKGMPGNAGVPYPDMGEISATKPPQGMMGATGTAIFSGVIQNDSKGEYNSDWYWRDFVPIIDQMRRSDGQIQAIEQAIRLPIQRATWSLQPATSDGADQVIASFVESCLIEGMVDTTADGSTVRTTWRETLEQILSYLWYGFMVFELCYTNPKADPDGYVRWARWLPMLPRSVWRWWTNGANDLVGIQQWTYRDYMFKFINVSAGKLLRFHHRMEGNNYDGWSLLRAAYMHWFHKVNLLNIAAVGVERNSISPPWFKLPAQSATATDYQTALTMAQNIRANEQLAIVTPDSWGVEYLNMRERQAEQVIPLIQYHDQLIARSVLAQFINLGSTETGAYSLDSSQKLTFLNALQSVAEYVADVINADAIKKLVDYNYKGVTVYPKLVCSKLVSQDLTILSDTLQKLMQYFPPSPELNDYLARELGLPATPQSFTQTTGPGQDAGGGADYQSDGSDQAKDGGTQDTNTQDGERSGYDNGDNGSSGGGYGDGGDSGGGAYTELAQESMLLREALDAAYGLDAVERGYEHETVMLGFPNQPRQKGGKFGPTGWVREHVGGLFHRGRGNARQAEHTSEHTTTERAQTSGGARVARSSARAGGRAAKTTKSPEEKLQTARANVDRLRSEHEALIGQATHAAQALRRGGGMAAEAEAFRANGAATLKGEQRYKAERALARLEKTAGGGGAAKTTAGATRAPKAATGRQHVPTPDSQLRTLDNPTNANEAWAKFGGTRAGFHEMLSREPIGALENMATRNGMGLPKGYERLTSSGAQSRALATHISDHMAARNGLPTAAQERVQARAQAKAATRSEKPLTAAAKLKNDWAMAQKEYNAPVRPTVKNVREFLARTDISPAARAVGQRQLAKVQQAAQARAAAKAAGATTTRAPKAVAAGKGQLAEANPTGMRTDTAGKFQLTPVTRIEGREIDIGAHVDPHFLSQLYGEHQLGLALHNYPHDALKEAWQTLRTQEGARPITSGTSKLATVQNIAAHVTEGRFRANYTAAQLKAASTAGAKAAKAEAAARSQAAQREFEQNRPPIARALRPDWHDILNRTGGV